MSVFSRIQLEPHHPRAREALQADVGFADAYGDHQHLWRFFPTPRGSPRDFLFRRLEPQGQGDQSVFYVLSARPPVVPHSAWRVETREYEPRLKAGDRLSFDLRANPTRAHERDGKGKRDDVVVHAKKQLAAQCQKLRWSDVPDDSRPPLYALVHTTVTAWFAGDDGKTGVASRHGFQVMPETIQVNAYRQHYFRRRNGHDIHLSTVDINGVLEVIDPERARSALLCGIGHGKAFGCGLLLARRLD